MYPAGLGCVFVGLGISAVDSNAPALYFPDQHLLSSKSG